MSQVTAVHQHVKGLEAGRVFGIRSLSEYGTLAGAVSAIGATDVRLVIPAGIHDVTANLTVPANVVLSPEPGAVLKPAAGKILTVNGPVVAPGAVQWLDESAAGSAVNLAGPVLGGPARPEWWGVDGTADGAEIRRAMLSAERVRLRQQTYVGAATDSYLLSGANHVLDAWGATLRDMVLYTSEGNAGLGIIGGRWIGTDAMQQSDKSPLSLAGSDALVAFVDILTDPSVAHFSHGWGDGIEIKKGARRNLVLFPRISTIDADQIVVWGSRNVIVCPEIAGMDDGIIFKIDTPSAEDNIILMPYADGCAEIVGCGTQLGPANLRNTVVLGARGRNVARGSHLKIGSDISPAASGGTLDGWLQDGVLVEEDGTAPVEGRWRFTADSATDTLTTLDRMTGAPAAHGYANGDPIRFYRGVDGALPGGLAEDTRYYVVNAATSTFQASTTVGGAAVNLTSVGTVPNAVSRTGYRFKALVEVQAKRSSKGRNITYRRLSARNVRCSADEPTYGIFVVADGAHGGSAVEVDNLRVEDVEITDAYQGQATDPATRPGQPIAGFVYVEEVAGALIKRLEIERFRGDGCANNGMVFRLASHERPVRLRGEIVLTNVGRASASYNGIRVLINTTVDVRDCRLTISMGGAGTPFHVESGGRLLGQRRDYGVVSASVSASTVFTLGAFLRKTYAYKVWVMVSSTITLDATNHWTFALRNSTADIVTGSLQSQMVAGQWYEVAVDHPTNSTRRAAAHFDAASDVLELQAAKSGSPPALANLRVMVEYVEYGDF